MASYEHTLNIINTFKYQSTIYCYLLGITFFSIIREGFAVDLRLLRQIDLQLLLRQGCAKHHIHQKRLL